MAVQAQFGGGLLAGCLPFGGGGASGMTEGALWNCGAPFLSASAAAQSELTCNDGGVILPSRKRGREYLDAASSSADLLPIPGIMQSTAAESRVVGSGMASISGRPESLVLELCRHGAEVDALVRAECDWLRAGLEHARKRQRQELAPRLVTGAAARRLREAEAELGAARRHAAELEERVRQAAAESQAWLGAARTNEAVAAGLGATLEHLLLLRGAASACADVVVEGFGDSDHATEADDAQSCCFVSKDTAAAATSPAGKWACKACGEGEASVLVLPCRHLCLCKACEPKLDACPVCLAAKNASIHVAPN